MNDCAYIGPAMAPAIVDILLRFKAYHIGIVADIEKAFLNIFVDENQRDLMRFLWLDDVNTEDPSIVTFRNKTFLFGMACSPF